MKPTVLVVDDKPNFLSLLTKVLSPDFCVVCARGTRQAVESLRTSAPDVVLCDLRMPDGDGLDVLRALRGSGSEAPFVLMTAYATVPTAVQAMREGAYDYITKPFDLDELKALVLRAAGEAGTRKEPVAREPRSTVERAAIPEEGPQPPESALPAEAQEPLGFAANSGRPLSAMSYREAVDHARDEGTRQYLEAVLALHHGNVTAAAHQAGVERESFHRLLRRHGLRAEAWRHEGVEGDDPKGERKA